MPMSSRHRWQPLSRAWGFGLLLICGMNVQAQSLQTASEQSARDACEKSFKPSTGQPGKDVVWVPTNDALVTRMLDMAKVNKNDLVYDLGAGDGKIAIAAAKQFGARAVGVEYNPDMAQLAQCMVRAERMTDRVKVVQGDIFATDFSSASVVTLYLLPELNLRLRPTILKMKPGTRVVSHSFLMDDWRPDESSVSTDGAAYLWIVPANAAGKWTFKQRSGSDTFDVNLTQTFQKLTGTAGKGSDEISNAQMHGTQIEMMFSEGDVHTRLKGELTGDRIEAEVTRNDKTSTYIGTRR
ncbi:MAG: class I SAM-dependent methyltransferase [Pseudomonadota bacterium]|nr:class I SAM-dependent methyltransferase [Pseudomonadota bacterium]